MNSSEKFVILAILDGWGISLPGPGNAISQANPVNVNRYWASYPHTQLKASGEAVGLPRGEAGNTETGHLNIGAGRIVYQDLERINMSIADGSFFKNPELLSALNHVKGNSNALHVMGLLGAGGVHSNMEHLFAILQFCAREGLKNVFLHLFTDGRDSPPTAANTYIARLREVIKKEAVGQIASITGRYWGMDRDNRWERTAKAYFALTRGQGNLVKTPEEAIEMSYAQGKTDEFIEPCLISSSIGKPLTTVKDGDSVIFFNFRIDRPRQLTKAFVLEDMSAASQKPDFDPYLVKYTKKHMEEAPHPTETFQRGPKLQNLHFVMMTEYSKQLVNEGAKVAYPKEVIDIPLGRAVSEAGLRQLRITESEKERFVTYYFNGQIESPFEGEERLIVPSPKVATYDLKPEMSAHEITENLLNKLKNGGGYSLVILNFPNPDMVAHTGNIGSAVKACRVVDECVGKIANFVLAYGGTLLITADHGNAEEMINQATGEISTEHSRNPVPFIAVSQRFLGQPQSLSEGILADIAPTVLGVLGISQPTSMTGRDLLKQYTKERTYQR